MKSILHALVLAAVGTATFNSAAQQAPATPPGPGGERPQRREGGPGGPGGGRGMMMRGGPLMVALDADKNGELSAAEIAVAATALKTLDKNSDGKLSAEELRPNFGEGGPGGARAEGDAEAVARFMSNDKNGDGKLTAEELPERMKGVMARADADKDGFLTKAELEKALANPPERREGGPRRERGERGERPAEAK